MGLLLVSQQGQGGCTVNEWFDNWFGTADAVGSVTVYTVLNCLIAAFVLSQMIAFLYVRTHRGLSYSVSVAQSLVALSLIIALVMLVVGNSVARAFGLFGALALIRFRTPIKDSRDTVYLFFSVAVGIAAGTQNILAAAIGTLVICAVLAYLHIVQFGTRYSHDGLVRFRCPASQALEEQIRATLKRHCDEWSLLHLRQAGPDNAMEFAYQVRMIDKSESSRLAQDITALPGISDLSLLMQDEEIEP